MATFYVSISNTDNKLTQQEWAAFYEAVDSSLKISTGVEGRHFAGFSSPVAPWQNAAWIFDMHDDPEYSLDDQISDLQKYLGRYARMYRQESIVMAQLHELVLIGPRAD